MESRRYLEFKQLPDGDMSHLVEIEKMGNDSFGEAVGETLWLDTYDEGQWPDFKPERYFQIGWSGMGRHWLFDLEDGMKIVEYSGDAKPRLGKRRLGIHRLGVRRLGMGRYSCP